MNSILVLLFSFMGVAMAIEEPAYTVVSNTHGYEVRRYDAILVAETQVNSSFEDAGNLAFKILAGYIFGANQSKTKISMTAPVNQEKIKMTAPVTQSKDSSGFLVQFTMPKQYTLETLPLPNDPRVKLRKILPRTIAVFSYSGSWSESRYHEKLKDFKDTLDKDAVLTNGEPVLARFNSPFQLWFLRRNEIWIEIINPN